MTDKRVLELIEKRSQGRCEVCGAYCEGEYDPHHRKLRSRGGLDEASNLLYICHKCHRKIHENPEWASERGYMVSSWSVPADIPFLHWAHGITYIGNEGGSTTLYFHADLEPTL